MFSWSELPLSNLEAAAAHQGTNDLLDVGIPHSGAMSHRIAGVLTMNRVYSFGRRRHGVQACSQCDMHRELACDSYGSGKVVNAPVHVWHASIAEGRLLRDHARYTERNSTRSEDRVRSACEGY